MPLSDTMNVADLESQLESISDLSNQKQKTQSYLTILQSLLTPPNVKADLLIALGRHLTTTPAMAMVVGRRVLGAFVTSLCAGSGMENAPGVEDASEVDWESLGKEAFIGDEGDDVRMEIVKGVLEQDGMGGWCEEQTTTLRHLYAHLLTQAEDWQGAAQALMAIPLEGGGRLIADEEKLAVYMKIVRLLLETGDSGQAQTYFSRASLLIHQTQDKETILSFKLSQARLFDHGARFNEAAQKYHEISWDESIAEEDRIHMLKAAVTTSILGPAGPQRSRILATLQRDDRIASLLPPTLSTMLRKMLLDQIVRPEEVKGFAEGLEDHQKAQVEGGGTVLERAVREHNVLACAKVYMNIGFDGLGALLDLSPDGAETMARKMIEQGRLRAWIDQPAHLLFFEGRAHDTDADAQGTAGGLGLAKVEKPLQAMSWTERWDEQIRATSTKVEAIVDTIVERDLLRV